MPERLTWLITPSDLGTVQLKLIYDRLTKEWYQGVSEGWPSVLSSLKSLLERGAPHNSTHTSGGLVLADNSGEQHGEVKIKVLDATLDKRVAWEIISTHPKRSPASAWTGTHIVFELTTRENPGLWLGISSGERTLTVLDFRHSGWVENNEFFGFCNFARGETLFMLKQWCEAP